MGICFYVVAIILIYYIGFFNILDMFADVISYIPVFNWPLGIIIDFVRMVFSFIPFYYIYAILICMFNVLFQFFVVEAMFRHRPNRKQLLETFMVILISFLAPVFVSMILINWEIVISLIVPFHLAATAFHVHSANRIMDSNLFRNFVIFVLLMPILRIPWNLGGGEVRAGVEI